MLRASISRPTHRFIAPQVPATEMMTNSRSQARSRNHIATVSVVIPVLNEASGLMKLLSRLKPVLEGIKDIEWDVVFIDDGSSDGTADELRRLNEDDPRIKAVTLSRNFGKEIAVAAGLAYAGGDAVVLMDGDLQHPPEIIPDFIAKWREGFDVVYGERTARDTDGFFRRLFSKGFYAAFHFMSGTALPSNAGDFRLLSRRAVDALNRMGERARFNKGLFAWIGYKSVGIPFDVADRPDGGKSRWRLRRLIHFALDGIASFSTLPMRVWSLAGLAVSLLAFGYAGYFLIKTMIFGADRAGFPTLIISIMMLSGIQLISLGVIGEYLGRVYEEVKARPLFLVSEEIGLASSTRAMTEEQNRPVACKSCGALPDAPSFNSISAPMRPGTGEGAVPERSDPAERAARVARARSAVSEAGGAGAAVPLPAARELKQGQDRLA